MNEKQPSAPMDDAPAAVPSVRMGYEVAVIVLFALSLFGVWRLVTGGASVLPGPMVSRFYVDISLAVLPLILWAAVLSYEVKLTEGLKLGADYHVRIEQMRKILESRENLLRLVSDYQAGAITIFDRHNRYWFVNNRAAKALGLDPAEIIGQPPIKVLPNEMAKKLEVKLAQARVLDAPLDAVEQVKDKAGQTRFIQSHYELLRDGADTDGCVLLREDDFTNLFVERERRDRMFKQLIDTLVAVVDRRDPYAAGHSSRVGQLSKAIATEMELDPLSIETAEIAGSLMNFGKVLVSRRILTKTTALSTEELQRVRDSILTSADILAIIGFEGPVVPTLRQVLERYDGTGVPKGLKGNDIMVTARIVAVANAFVAFVSPRAHREGLAFHEALSFMARDVGKAFDEHVLIALTNYIENRPNKLDWLKVTKQESL